MKQGQQRQYQQKKRRKERYEMTNYIHFSFFFNEERVCAYFNAAVERGAF